MLTFHRTDQVLPHAEPDGEVLWNEKPLAAAWIAAQLRPASNDLESSETGKGDPIPLAQLFNDSADDRFIDLLGSAQSYVEFSCDNVNRVALFHPSILPDHSTCQVVTVRGTQDISKN